MQAAVCRAQSGLDASTGSNAHGSLVYCGAVQAPRLLAARLRPALRNVHLIPQPRGAFSDLAAAPVGEHAMGPDQVMLLSR